MHKASRPITVENTEASNTFICGENHTPYMVSLRDPSIQLTMHLEIYKLYTNIHVTNSGTIFVVLEH